jgi:hypothetical protein
MHSESIAQARQAIDFSECPMLRALGTDQQQKANEMIEQSLAELFERNWLVEKEQLSVTDAGKAHLRQRSGAREEKRTVFSTVEFSITDNGDKVIDAINLL